MASVPRLSVLSLALLLGSAGMIQGAAQICRSFTQGARADVSCCQEQSKMYPHIQEAECGHNPRMSGGQEVAIWVHDHNLDGPHHKAGPYGNCTAYRKCKFPLKETPDEDYNTYYWTDQQTGASKCLPDNCTRTECTGGLNCIRDPQTVPPVCGCETSDGKFHPGLWTWCEGRT